jgi:signal transduction histidine kinase
MYAVKTTQVPGTSEDGRGSARVQRSLRAVTVAAGASVSTISLVALLGWVFGTDVFAWVGMVSLVPHMAAALLALGTAVLLLVDRPGRVAVLGARTIAVLVLVAGALALMEYVAPGIMGVAPAPAPGEGPPFRPWRMEPASAVGIVLLAASLALYDLASKRAHRAAEALVVVVGVIAFERIFEHAFDIDRLYGLGTLPRMPVHTAIALLALSVGAILLRTERGWARILVDPGAAGVTLRRLIPVSLAAPLIVGWFIHMGVTMGLLAPVTGLKLLVSSIGVLLLSAVAWTTRELHRIDHERMSLIRSEREARDEAEEASRAKSDFLGVMSHELRTPLNSVIAYADLLDSGIKGPLNEDQLRYVDRIRVGGSHLRAMIDELLQFTRARQGAIRVEMRQVDAVELAREALAVVDHEVDAVELCPQLPDDSVGVVTDPDKVLHVLVNFLGNALKFTTEGRVGLRLRCESGRVLYEVWDTGPGIPKEDLHRIFQEFAQLDTGVNGRKGVGLGLAISRAYAEAIGGRVEVDSWVGRGSVFRLVLPEQGGSEAVPRAERETVAR